MNLDVIVRLKDLLSGPLRGIKGALNGVIDAARKIGFVGAAIAGISFLGPMQEAAAFQQQLIDIAGTSNLTGQAAFAFVDQSKAKFEQLALDVGQLSDTVARGAGQMIAAGVDNGLVDRSIGSISRAATAANAEMNDMASVATSLLTTLKLPADQLDDAMGALVTAGKLGSFELKDMSRYFPTLTGQMAKFGVTGREAINFLGSALQIARKGTSDPAEAANNLKNFLSKILAPATVKNFADMGVDIQSVMQDAVTKGINPIEAVVQKITKLTGVSSKEIQGLMGKAKAAGMSDADALATVREQLEKIYGAGKLGELFSDMQVMDFLIPMLGNIDEYKSIKDEVAKATGSAVDADFETQMQGLNRQLTIFREIGTQASREVGLAFGTWMPAINGYLMDGLKWVRDFDAATGGMVKQGLAFAGVAVLAAVGLGVLGVVLPAIGAGLSVLAALFSPVGIALAGIAAAGVYIYRNWSSYGPRLSQMWNRLGDVWGTVRQKAAAAVPHLRNIGNQVMGVARDLAGRYGPIIRAGLGAALDDVTAGWQNLKKLMSGFADGLDLKFDLSGLTIEDAKLAAFRGLDVALNGIARAWQGMKEFGSGFAPWLEPIGKAAGGAVRSIGGIATGFIRLGAAIRELVGLGEGGKMSGMFTGVMKFLGDLGGQTVLAAFKILEDVAGAIEWVVKGLASLVEAVNRGINWSALMPDGIAEAWNSVATALERVKAALSIESVSNALGVSGKRNLTEFGPGSRQPANQNGVLPAQASPTAPAAPQQLNVKTEAKVVVEGPGKVVGQTTTVTSPSPNVNTGRAVGRD
ncbi:phage tail tape measure protein [Agrobacterium sp. S7/73]|uniref:phage tail tape measure protein n=1 Tax=Agrobacterium sp. S7/73 TaxID=2820002 RepID=UPI001C5ADE5B|nr:phage tail tape measure protein [Agrobacterium sp. S7/73]QXZ71872.1 phage tail tape measure protein [Agrobacterium sp. S7/73]QXZ74660.1 phage tail tape measure protein [Agrobacterium sp. S7/73]